MSKVVAKAVEDNLKSQWSDARVQQKEVNGKSAGLACESFKYVEGYRNGFNLVWTV